MSGYEYPGSIGSELVASASWPNDFGPKDSVLLRDEYNRVMQLERRLVFQTYVKPRLIAIDCKESTSSVMQKTFQMPDYVTNQMRLQSLAKYGRKGGVSTLVRRAAQRRVASMIARGKVSSTLSPKLMLRGTAFLITFNGVWGVYPCRLAGRT